MAKNPGVELDLHLSSSRVKYHILDFQDYPESSPFRMVMGLIVCSHGNYQDIKLKLKDPEIFKKFSREVKSAGEEFQDWLEAFKECKGNTYGFFDNAA